MTPTFLPTTQDGKTVLVEICPTCQKTDFEFCSNAFHLPQVPKRTIHTDSKLDNRAYREDELEIRKEWLYTSEDKWIAYTDDTSSIDGRKTRLFATLKQVEKPEPNYKELAIELPPNDLDKLQELWYARYPCHDTNADTEKDMFWGTVDCVFRDYYKYLITKAETELKLK